MARSTETDQETALYWVKKGTRVKKNIYITNTTPKNPSTFLNIRGTIKILPCPAPSRRFITDNDDVSMGVKTSPTGRLTTTSNLTQQFVEN